VLGTLDLDLATEAWFDPFPAVRRDQDAADIEVVVFQPGRILPCVGGGMDGEEPVVTPPLHRTVDNPDDVEIRVHHSGNSMDVGSGEGVTGAA